MSKRIQHEHAIQAAFFRWAALQKHRLPGIELIFAIPNGGFRHWKTARFLKAEGVKPGVPDAFLPIPKGPYHGLFIEFKYGKNKLTPAQLEFSQCLRSHGYLVAVCYSLTEAIATIEKYFAQEHHDNSPRKRTSREE